LFFRDLSILCDGATFRVHKMLLATCSTVFKDALIQDNQCHTLDVTGRSGHTAANFKVFLDRLYIPILANPEEDKVPSRKLDDGIIQ
jgi:hypothetical protein